MFVVDRTDGCRGNACGYKFMRGFVEVVLKCCLVGDCMEMKIFVSIYYKLLQSTLQTGSL